MHALPHRAREEHEKIDTDAGIARDSRRAPGYAIGGRTAELRKCGF
jgi:hypothetical protein